jgi:hypothetical protein
LIRYGWRQRTHIGLAEERGETTITRGALQEITGQLGDGIAAANLFI